MASPPRNSRQQRRAQRAGRRNVFVGAGAAVLVVTALVVGYVALSGGGDEPKLTGERAGSTGSTTVPPSTLAPDSSLIAEAKSDVPKIDVFDTVDAQTPSRRYDNPWLLNDEPGKEIPQVFVVRAFSGDRQRLQVLLPERPNGTMGWVKTDDFNVSENHYSIRVSLAEHKITVKDGPNVIYEGPVAIGSPTPLPDSGGKPTPTPTGVYYVRVLLKNIEDPTSVYGPYAYGLSAHSETLETYNGGDAEVGIHGNNDPSVLGSSVTHGCIRMDNDEITKLAGLLPLGTPVIIN